MKYSYQIEKKVEDFHWGVFNNQKYFARYRKELAEVNDIQCDIEDFKNFMKYKGDSVQSIIVETDKKEVWIWTKPVEKNGRKTGGWEFVKKIK